MLKYSLLHPQILSVLGRAGHRSQVLIADGNYPSMLRRGPRSELVSLNLAPGLVTATDVLRVLLTATPFEAAHVMEPDRSGPYAMKEDPAIWKEFDELLREAGTPLKLEPLKVPYFYDAASGPDLALVIVTGEQRIYANLLLTIGVVQPTAKPARPRRRRD